MIPTCDGPSTPSIASMVGFHSAAQFRFELSR
jgi:hypothetical protein